MHKSSLRCLMRLVAFFAFALASMSAQNTPWFFAILSDPQMGMYAHDRDFAQETANLEFAVANLNRLHPQFIVVCGDLVNRTGDAAEIAEYKRILQKLDPSVPVYNVAGNHDLGNVPTPKSIRAYRAAFGKDFYSFKAGPVFGIVLDSSLISAPQKTSDAARQQRQWLADTLKNAPAGRQIIVFQHIPYFIHDPAEKDQYFNIPAPQRRDYLDLLKKHGVRSVFAGHYHRNAGGTDGPLNEVVTGAVGMPIGGSLSGLRLVSVSGNSVESRWYCLGDIPNQVPGPGLPSSHCPQ
jgi:serine/threonine-protein phosphatase CPPED1